MKVVTYTAQALRSLSRMPHNIATRIQTKVEQFAADPASLANNVKALKGEPSGTYRLRVGDYRVCLLYTSPSPRDRQKSRMPSSA